MGTSYGKVSTLTLSASRKGEKTILDDIYFTAPFKIAKPFVQPDNSIKVMVMFASAGIMEGDAHDIHIHIGDHSKICMTSQSYEKIHKMNQGEAHRMCQIEVGTGAYLRYTPLPTIPFAQSAFTSTTRVQLKDDTARLAFYDIVSCGRYARGEYFQYRHYKSLMEVERGDVLLYRDNTVYTPEDMDMNGFGLFEGYTHLANISLFHFGLQEDALAEIASLLESPEVDGGLSSTWNGDVVIRILGKDSQTLTAISDKIIDVAEKQTVQAV